MPKIIRILRSCSMKIFSKFPTINISKLNYWLVICIAKNFIWTTLKMIFSIFRFFCTLRFQIFKYCPIITNHTSMESYLFRWCINLNSTKLTLMTGFVVQGHICQNIHHHPYNPPHSPRTVLIQSEQKGCQNHSGPLTSSTLPLWTAAVWSTLQSSEHQNDQTQEQFLPPSNPSHEHLTLTWNTQHYYTIIYSPHIHI